MQKRKKNRGWGGGFGSGWVDVNVIVKMPVAGGGGLVARCGAVGDAGYGGVNQE